MKKRCSQLIAPLAIVLLMAVGVYGQINWPEGGVFGKLTQPHDFDELYGCAAIGNKIWVVDTGRGILWHLDPEQDELLGKIRAPAADITGVAFDGLYLWVASDFADAVLQIDPESGAVVHRIWSPSTSPAGVAWDGSNLWIGDRNTRKIYQIDAVDGTVLHSLDLPGPSPRGLTWFQEHLYLVDSFEQSIYQLDPASGKVVSRIICPTLQPRGICVIGDVMWYCDRETGVLQMEIQVASQANYVRSNPTTRTVDYSYTIRNPGPNDVKNAVLNIATPVSDEGQLVLSLDWASPPNRYFTDPFGTRVASFDIGTIRRDTTVVVGFTAQVQLWSIAYVIDPDVVGTVRDTPLEISNLYTIDGSYYAISDSFVISTAQAVVGSETNPYLMAIQIHDYVATTLDYVFDNVRDPAPEVLRRGSGSCSEFSFAFIALARASGLAARFAHAWATGEHATHSHELEATDSVEDTSGHRWVEVYVPGYGWIPFDPTWDRERHVFPGMAKQTYIGARPMVTLVRNRGGGTSREYLWEVYPTKFSSLNSRQTERSQVAIWSFPDGRGG